MSSYFAFIYPLFYEREFNPITMTHINKVRITFFINENGLTMIV